MMTRLKMIKIASLLFSAISLLINPGHAIGQQKFELNAGSTRRALQRGEIAAALAYYEASAFEAENNAEKSRSPEQYWGAARIAYKQASRAAKFSGQAEKMLAYSEKSLLIARKIDKPVRILSSLNDVIWAHKYVKNFRRVDQSLEEGFAIARSLPVQSSSRYYWDGILYGHLGDQDERRRNYDAAVKSFSLSVGHLGNYLSTIRGNSRQSQLRREVGRGSFLVRLTKLGDSYRQAHRLPEALNEYQRAFKLIRDWGYSYAFKGDLYNSIGDVHVRLNQISEALDSFNKALALAENQQMPRKISRASTAIGNILRRSGRADDAIVHYRRSIEQIESTRSLLQSEEFRQSFFEGGLGVYVSVIDSFLKAGKQEDAFNYNERARSRGFLDLLGTKVPLSRAGSLAEEERSLQGKISALNARLAGQEDVEEQDEEEPEPVDTGQLRRELIIAQKDFDSFLAKVRKENKEQASLMSVEPLTLKQVQELLDPAVSLLEYFVTPNDVLLWVVDKEGVNSMRIPLARKGLASKLNALRETISQIGSKESFQLQSEELYKLLIQPALPHIKGNELIVVTHDVLHYLPFHALQGSDGKYLIEQYPISYLSSASLLQFTKEKRTARAENILAFGNPDLGDRSRDLDYAELEAQEVQSAYPSARLYVRREATEERAKALSPQNDIIHFASHAELKENDPLSSAVLLAKSGKEDGRLEVREIFGMNLKANLVVLSACDTGLGKLSSGDELVGLTRAFIYAGTPSVIASLWQVDDVATSALMSKFYKNLKTMTKVEALRQAQLELIKGQGSSDILARRGIAGIRKLGETPSANPPAPDTATVAPNREIQMTATVSTSHPYFWAPFILVGDGK